MMARATVLEDSHALERRGSVFGEIFFHVFFIFKINSLVLFLSAASYPQARNMCCLLPRLPMDRLHAVHAENTAYACAFLTRVHAATPSHAILSLSLSPSLSADTRILASFGMLVLA